jgi:hypothetical protein
MAVATALHVMMDAKPAGRPHAPYGDGSIFSGLLRGYRFHVCEEPSAAGRALAIRRHVYQDASGYDVPVPDAYDARSWLLVAEDATTGDAVGSLRITPRWAGRLEVEESFVLPPDVLTPRLCEVTRFAILPRSRDSRRFLPSVALGLLKLCVHFLRVVGADRVVACSRLERVQTYRWLRFRPTGISGPYRPLDGTEHTVLTCDLGRGLSPHRDHRYWTFFVEIGHPEIVLPRRIPPLGIPEIPRLGPRLAPTLRTLNGGSRDLGPRNGRSWYPPLKPL